MPISGGHHCPDQAERCLWRFSSGALRVFGSVVLLSRSGAGSGSSNRHRSHQKGYLACLENAAERGLGLHGRELAISARILTTLSLHPDYTPAPLLPVQGACGATGDFRRSCLMRAVAEPYCRWNTPDPAGFHPHPCLHRRDLRYAPKAPDAGEAALRPGHSVPHGAVRIAAPPERHPFHSALCDSAVADGEPAPCTGRDIRAALSGHIPHQPPWCGSARTRADPRRCLRIRADARGTVRTLAEPCSSPVPTAWPGPARPASPYVTALPHSRQQTEPASFPAGRQAQLVVVAPWLARVRHHIGTDRLHKGIHQRKEPSWRVQEALSHPDQRSALLSIQQAESGRSSTAAHGKDLRHARNLLRTAIRGRHPTLLGTGGLELSRISPLPHIAQPVTYHLHAVCTRPSACSASAPALRRHPVLGDAPFQPASTKGTLPCPLGRGSSALPAGASSP